MKKTSKFFWAKNCWLRVIVVALMAFAFAACPTDGGGDSPATPAAYRVYFNTNLPLGEPETNFTAANPLFRDVGAGDALGSFPTDPSHNLNGYYFAGWYDNAEGTGTQVAMTRVITGDTHLYARWVNVVSYSIVSFDVNNDGYSPAPAYSGASRVPVAKNAAIGALPADPTRSGDWNFLGWFDTANKTGGTALTASTTINDNVTYYARWIDTVVANPANNWTTSAGAANITVTATEPDSLKVSWARALSGVQHYELYMGATASSLSPIGGTQVTGSLIGGADSYSVTVSGLTNGTAYYFSVVAIRNYTRTSPQSGVDGTPLGRVSGLSISAQTANSFTLSWTAAVGATSYDVLSAGPGTAQHTWNSNVKDSSNQTETTFTKSNITEGGTYWVWVVAKNASGESGVPNENAPMIVGYTQDSLVSIAAKTMPTLRAYDTTGGIAPVIDWTGLVVTATYTASSIDINYGDPRLTVTNVTYNAGAYSQPSAPGANVALDALLTFNEGGTGLSKSAQLASGSLSSTASRNVYFANLPTTTYFKGGDNGALMQAVTGATVGPEGRITVSGGSGNVEARSVFANTNTLSVTVADYKLARYMVTVYLATIVNSWATNAAYNFARQGQNYAGLGAPAGSTDLPTSLMYPANYFNLQRSVAFCNALSEMLGMEPRYYAGGNVVRDGTNTAITAQIELRPGNGFRMPTDTEWEYAARGGYPSASWKYNYIGMSTGSPTGNAYAYGKWIGFTTSPRPISDAAAVGSLQDNSLGFFDMTGNIADLYWNYTAPGSYGVTAYNYVGGHFYSDMLLLNPAYRVNAPPLSPNSNSTDSRVHGLRLAQD